MPDTATVEAEQERLAAAALVSAVERGTTCCYATQDKFWLHDAPDGESWEVYTVLADSAAYSDQPEGATCGAPCCTGTGGAG